MSSPIRTFQQPITSGSLQIRVHGSIMVLSMSLLGSPAAVAAEVYGFGGQFVEGTVYATTYFNGDLIAGGPFNSAGGATGSRFLARWNGTGWVGMNMPGAVSGPGTYSAKVEALAVHQGELFVGGHMRSINGAPSDNIIRWDGITWRGLNYGVNGPVYALLSSGNDLYVGGEFISAGVVPMNRVARWDGTTWNALGTGLEWAPAALVEYGGEIVAGGTVYSIDGDIATVSAWNGTDWHPLGQSLGYGWVNDLEVFNGILVAAGEFDLAGGSNLAWLDGDTWRPLGGGTGDGGSALTIAGSRLYVAGGFSNVGSGASAIPANSVAAWDGTAWGALTSGVSGHVEDLFSDGTDVIVAGEFEFAGGLAAPDVVIWNGSAWDNSTSNYGNALNEPARALLSSGGSLVVGGAFTWAGGQAANRIASWDGTWHTYGSGFNGGVSALAEFNGSIIAAGGFTLSGLQPVNRIAQWDGTSWLPDLVSMAV